MKMNLQFVCRCRSCPPRHRDPHGPWGGSRRSTLCQGGCVEQLLYATAHAQRMPTVDTLLLPSTLSPGESSLVWYFHLEVSFSHISLSSVCQIVNEPPPLWEVPSNCNNFTAKVFRAGLQKDPDRRASAKDLRRKTTKALRAGRWLTYSRTIW